MTVPFNDLARAARLQHEELASATEQVLQSGWFINGPNVRGFQEEFASYLGVGHVHGLASGTDALEIALRALRTDDRSTVVTAANSGGYATCAAQAMGMSVRFADVDEQTHCLTPVTVAGVVDDDTFAVVVTHLYGTVADVAGIRAVCEPRGIAVLEDCAQAAGARGFSGRAGSLGDIATFSFYPTKNLAALGDGGAIATNRDDLSDRVVKLAQYGWEGKYRAVMAGGRNSRLDELQAAYLRLRLPHLDDWNQRRRDIVTRYAAAAPDGVRVLPVHEDGNVAHLAVVVTEDAPALAEHLAVRGIRTDVHYPIPDDRQPYRQVPEDPGLRVTHSLMGRVLSLPCFPELTDDEITQVCDALHTF